MASAANLRGLVILDRDGVINRDSPAFVKSVDEWIPLPGSIRAIAALHRGGFTVTVASNQSGISRGLLDRKTLRSMHRKLRRLVEAEGGHVDRIVVCPHGPEDGCACRKPGAGLLRRLGRHYKTSLDGIPVIGDSLRDLQAAAHVGARPILVRSGNGRKTEAALSGELAATEVYEDLAAAASALLEERDK